MKKIGFIGCGNMATAIISGLIKSSFLASENIIVSDLNEVQVKQAKERFNISIGANNIEVAKNVDLIVLAVKPQYYNNVINEIKDVVDEQKIIMSIAAGQTIDNLETNFYKKIKLVRVMPNTPAMVGEAMSAISTNAYITDEDKKYVFDMLSCFGKATFVPENLMDTVIGVSGSSPAYAFMFIEAMADGAVKHGMPRKQAYEMASQAVLGAAKMVLETGIHPGELKDMVSSPGGTTIEAISTLEKTGFRSSVIEAMDSCIEKSKKMSTKLKYD